MDELRNYKFRLYPTALQEQQLVETLDGCRWLYNYFLKLSPISEYDMNYALTELKEQEPWLRNYHSKMLQMVGKQITAAQKALAVLSKNGHKVGKLHYLTHDEYNSFTYNQSGFKVKGDELWLSKIGGIIIRLHKQPTNIKQVIICRENGKWYAVMSCELKQAFKIVNPNKLVGIDLGIAKFCHDSDNNIVENPLFLKKMIKPLRRVHRRVSRRQKGSKNREKARAMLARLHKRIHNKRNDFLHKLSNYYSKRFDIIFLERLRTLKMVKNHHLARHILDSGWCRFKEMLKYKAKMMIELEPYNTSIDCNRCGNRVPKSLAVRIHRCDKCILVIDRDHNASLNILNKGLFLLPMERRKVTPAEIVHQCVKQESEATVLIRLVHTEIGIPT